MRLSRPGAVFSFLMLAGLWYALFFIDAGNFSHGGSAWGLVATQGAATIGTLAFIEVLRSDTDKALKCVFGVVAVPLVVFVGGSLFYAARQLFAV